MHLAAGPALMTVTAATSREDKIWYDLVAHGPALSVCAPLSPEKHVPECEGPAALL